ncbi:MAG: DegV family protein [Lachnospiraceae bacterium]|nr:DegV family protein [Lachnospiraceae bacterium]
MIRIITDSAIDIRPSLKDRIQQIPMLVSFGDEEYLDGVDLEKNEFYTRLDSCRELPVTSQISPVRFTEVFEEVTRCGDSALVLTISSELSGTYQSACLAAQDFDNIRVVDTRNATAGGGILAEYAMNCRDKGMNLEELAAAVEQKREDVCLVAMLDTLKFLQKGGRISRTKAIAGGMLNVKPAISIENGTVEFLGQVRGAKKADNFLMKKIEETGVNYDLPILLVYSGTSDERLQTYVENSRTLWENKVDPLEAVQLCTVVGTHIGPGAIGAAYFRA